MKGFISDSAKRIALNSLRDKLQVQKSLEKLIQRFCTSYWNKSDIEDSKTEFWFESLNSNLTNLRKCRAKIKKIENAIKEIKQL